VVLALVTNGWVALGFIPLTALGAVVTPALQGLMSQSAADNQQGELQGVISSAKSLAAIMAPLAMTQLFFVFTTGGRFFPGAPFVLSAALMVLCLSVFLAGRAALVRRDV
jgi:MFS transporter, DHA1 family, tetracycline resistance protein